MLTNIFNPKVSIIIPVYNGSDFLAQAIDSALAQTYKNIEILVINDGSNDDGETERLAMSYGDKISYFFKPNGGVASALNMGILKMTGEYFSWLSHDDLYTKDKIEKQIRALTKFEKGVVIYSNYSMFTKDPKNSIPVYLKGVHSTNFRYWITIENKLHGCTLLIPKIAFEKVGSFNENLRTTQDYDLWFRMAKEFNFVHIPEILVKARSHADQGSHKMAGIALKECNDLLSNFIMGLDSQEIISATNKLLGDSYADIASSMFNRGYNDAGRLADKFAQQNDFNDKVIIQIRNNIKYLKNKVIYRGKKLLSIKVKNMIKTIMVRE